MRAGLGLALLFLLGCAQNDLERANVVLIGIDTLRADHLGCYGYARPTSPHIDALAAGGVLFTTTVSQAPWTLPAFASILTGLLPSHHRAGEGTLPYVSRLEDEQDTLAEILGRSGYDTASFVSNVWVGKDVGLDRGFAQHEFDMQPARAVERAVEWLSARGERPFFLFLHVFDPHAPYAPPAEHARPFVAADYQGPFGTVFPTVWRNGVPSMDVDPHWSAADRQRIVDLYDAEVHYADSLVGRIVETLAARKLAARTIVAVVADHGEELFDHRKLGHSHTLYDELLLVPLVIRFGDARVRGRVTEQVRSMDLFPTLLEAVGEPLPPDLDAVSLLPLARGGRPAAGGAPAFAESVSQGPDPGEKALRLPGEKLIVSPATGRRTYFDLAMDPREQQDRAGERQERVQELDAVLAQSLLAPLGGYYLVAAGREAHDVHLRLQADAGFMTPVPLHTEDADVVTLAPDGRSLDVRFALRPAASPVAAHDLDGVRFQTRDGGRVVFGEATLDGKPLPARALRLGAGVPTTLEGPGQHFADETLIVSYPRISKYAADADFTLGFQLVRPPQPSAAALDAKTVDRLRALGYVAP